MPTNNYNFPFPSSNTAPDVPLHFQELAVAVDTRLKLIADSITSDNNTTYSVDVGGTNNAPTIRLSGSDNTTDSITITAGSNVTIDRLSENEIRINAEDDSPTYTAGTGLELLTNQFSLKHLGIQTLTDPNADRILFWDDSETSTAWLDLGTGLSITGTTLSLDGDLAAIGELTGTSGFLKKTAVNTWELDTAVAANNQTFFIGTTQVAINRTSGSLSLTGVSIDGTAGSATNLSGTTQYSIPYQSASGTTAYLSIGAANKILAVNSTATGYTWVDNGAGGSSTLSGLTDVQINTGTLGTGQVLKYDGTKWVNGEDVSGTGGSSGNTFLTISGTSGSVSPDITTDTLVFAVTGGGLTIVAGEVSTVDTLTFELDSDLKGIASATLNTAGFLKTNGSGTYSVIEDKSSEWNAAYADRLKWDGGSTGLTASTGRTSLGATTVGSNIFTLTDPSAIRFLRINADNTVSSLSDSDFRIAIGLGTMATAATTDYAALAGATFTGTVIAPAATTSISSLRLPHGTAPTTPTNGDIWTTTDGMYIRINGATVGPLGTGGGGSGSGDVVGPNSSTDNAVARFDLASGKIIQNSGVLIDDLNNLTVPADLEVNGGDIATTSATFNLLNANAITINFASAGTAVTIGATTGFTQVRNLQLGTTSSTTEGRISWDATYHHAYIGDGTNNMLVPTFRINATRTSGTLTAADCNTMVQFNNTTDITVTLPTDTNIPIGSQIHLLRLNTGNIDVTSTNVIATPGYRLRSQYSTATLIKRTATQWLLVGDLIA